MKILLFDMDGVLLEARAYHQALREVVERIGRALGFRQVNLTLEDIHFFESVGVTSEWDSSAICHALLLERVWEQDPNRRLPSEPPLPEFEVHELKPPDFQGFFRLLSAHSSSVVPSFEDVEQILLEGSKFSSAQIETIRDIFRNARHIEGSITHRLFQELILGSQVFREQYGLEASEATEGYLLTLDVPTLSEEQTGQFLEWLARGDHFAAIFTNRPSMPLGDFFDTPESELGLKLVGLEGVPIVGHGSLAWMTEKRGLPTDSLLKPSPVHALTALRCALGDDVELALKSAVSLVLDGVGEAGWVALDGAQVTVFEDAVKGLLSAIAARESLKQQGISIDLHLRGVSSNENKAYALREAGARVFETFPAALAGIVDLE